MFNASSYILSNASSIAASMNSMKTVESAELLALAKAA
jgi:hypothetical protein